MTNQSTTVWMNNIRNSVREIRKIVKDKGQISLGDAESIAVRNGAQFSNVLAELEHVCIVHYHAAMITCQK